MKTPEEIKLEIQECCEQIADSGLALWVDGEFTEQVLGDALALIRQLETDKQQLEGMLTHMNQLRDAAAGRALQMEERVHQLEAQVPRWIPMKKQLPPKGKSVIVMNGHGYVTMLALVHKVKNYWTWIGIERVGHYNDITHWMPLPERPEEG